MTCGTKVLVVIRMMTMVDDDDDDDGGGVMMMMMMMMMMMTKGVGDCKGSLFSQESDFLAALFSI